MKILTNPYLVAVGIPLLLMFCGALAKKLVRGTGWQRTDFYLGVELSLAAMASALVYMFDLAQLGVDPAARQDPLFNKMIAAASFLAICFLLLFSVMSIHQDWERRTQNPKGQVFWLFIFANGIGAGLMVAFVLYVKGV